MKKIISFVLLAAMLVTLIVPSALAADPFTAVAADSIEVMEGGKTVTTGLKLAANSGNLEAFGGIIFWKADAGVADVALSIDNTVFNASNTKIGSIVPGSNRYVKNDLAPFGANTDDYKACKLDMEAIAALNETGKVADITFTFENATVKGQTFTFSIVTTYANDTDPVSEDKADATITILEDPNLGKYATPTLFIVPEAETIVPGTTTLKVDVRVDANPGMWGGLYVLTYPESWTLASDTCGSVFLPKNYEGGTYDKKVSENLDYLRDRLASYPETPTEGYSYMTAYFDSDGDLDVNYNSGILASYVFNVPSGMAIGDTADFGIIYDREGDFILAEEGDRFTYLKFDVVGATVTMNCEHTSTHEVLVADATCGADGSKNVVCDACGSVVDTIVLPATGAHTYVDKVTDATCLVDGSKYKECSVCGDRTAVETIPALGHDMAFVETVPASCTAGGYDLYRCTRCDAEEHRNETTILDHTPGEPVVTPATCTEDGKSVVSCTACGTVISTTVIPALGHDWDDGTVTPPTCEAAGYTTKTCKRCGETTAVDFVDALGHEMAVTERVEPTCTTDGKIVRTCSNGCGKTETEILEKLGHAYDSGVVTTEPTCTEKGVKTFTCSRCGDTYTEDIDALGHAYDNGTVTTEPTCTEKGVKTFTCSRCGDTYTEEVAALGHTWDDGEVTTEPTCTEKGEKTFTCTVCEEKKTEEVDALGHTWDEGVVTKKPTETEKGVKTYTCTVCNATKEEAIPVLEPEKKDDSANGGELSLDGVAKKDGKWNIPVKVKKEYLNASSLSFTLDFDATKNTFKGIDGLKEGTYEVTEKNGQIVLTIKDFSQLKSMKEGDQFFTVLLDPKDANAEKADLGLKLVDSYIVKSPTTGDNMMYIVIALVAVVLTATAVVVIRKRKENN